MRGHSGHRVFVGCKCCLSFEGVDLGIVGHHALVHAVEGQLLSVGTPEGAFVDAELIAVNTLPINYFPRTIGRYLMLRTVSRSDPEVLIL